MNYSKQNKQTKKKEKLDYTLFLFLFIYLFVKPRKTSDKTKQYKIE